MGAVALLSLIVVGTGDSAWVYTNITGSSSTSVTATLPTSTPVAYVTNSSGTTYYTDIGKALNAAHGNAKTDTIYVVPELKVGNTTELPSATSVTLSSNSMNGNTSSYYVDSGDALSLPYSGTTLFSLYKDSNNADATNTTSALHDPSTYCMSQLVISSGISLTNNGTINIGGILGGAGGSYNPAGQTCDKYAEILCEGSDDGSPNLVNNGTIVNWGSIRGENISEGNYGMINNSGSSLTTPFVVFENHGGSAFIEMGGGYIAAGLDALTYTSAPFNRFYFPNTSVRMRTVYGATIYGQATMYGNSAHNQCIVSLFGKESTFLAQPSSGSYIETYVPMEATPVVNGSNLSIGYTGKIITPLEIDFYGSFAINYLKMSISALGFTRSISTADCMFPISYYLRASCYTIPNASSATVTTTQNLKILPGGSLYIGSNVSFAVSKLAVYDNTQAITWTGRESLAYPSTGFDGGEFVVDGSATISTFGGYVSTTQTGASFTIGTNSITSSEFSNADKATTVDYTFSATGPTSSSDDSTLGVGTYTSKEESGAVYWSAPEKFYIEIDPAGGESGAGSEGSFTVTITMVNGTSPYTVTWSLSGTEQGKTFTTSSDTATISFTTPANSDTSSNNNYTLTVSVTDSSGGDPATASGTFVATKKAGTCLLPGTLITMSDGSQMPVEDIKAGDYVMALNHETGEIEPSVVLFNDHVDEETRNVDVTYLNFAGSEVGVIYEHGFFDLTLNEYVYIDSTNYGDYLDHEFVYMDENGELGTRTLTSARVETQTTHFYSPVTYSTLNYFTEGMLSMPGGISGLFNYFEYDPDTLAYDAKQKAADIETYGLFTYDDFKDTGLTEDAFYAYNGQYLKVSIGKGRLTWDDIEYLISRYGKYF